MPTQDTQAKIARKTNFAIQFLEAPANHPARRSRYARRAAERDK
jgi:hypothetical protein